MSTTTDPPTIPHGRYADQPIEAVPKHQLQWMTAMNVSVSDKITALLERCSNLKRGSDLHVMFDDAGEAAARAIAAADVCSPQPGVIMARGRLRVPPARQVSGGEPQPT